MDDQIVERVKKVAQDKSISCAQVAIAWLFTKPYVNAPIVGVSSIQNLEDLVRAFRVQLTPEEIEFLEEPYRPKVVVGLGYH